MLTIRSVRLYNPIRFLIPIRLRFRLHPPSTRRRPPPPATIHHPITMRFIHHSVLVAGVISAREALGFFAPSHRAATSSTLSRHDFAVAVKSSSKLRPAASFASVSSASTSSTQLFGWGPDPIWSTAFVESNIQSCPSGSCVSLKVNVDDGTEFIYPGQYVQVKPTGGTCAV